MADQLTTVASLPSGYATLLGVICAAVLTKSRNWDLVVWNRIASPFYNPRWRGKWTEQEDPKLESKLDEEHRQLIDALIRCITKHARHFSSCGKCETQIADWAAALNVLYSALIEAPELDAESSENLRHQSDIPLTTFNDSRPAPGPTDDPNGNGLSQSTPANLDAPPELTFQVELLNGDRETKHHSIPYSEPWLLKTLSDSEIRINSTPLSTTDICHITSQISDYLHNSPSASSKLSISLQLAASLEAFTIELGFKALELLLASAIILGSTGGAWLGLTMASLFPARHAAGAFSSAYGQVQPEDATELASFRAAGTVWGCSYCIYPRGWTDESRVGVGYALEFGCLVAVRYFKLLLRSALGFNEYAYTRDAIRYILLVAEFVITIFMTRALYGCLKGRRSPERRLLPVVLYAVFFGMCLAGVVLGQHDFMKPLWKFYALSKAVDLIAALGSLMAMMATMRKAVSAPKWVMMWAMGVCSAYFERSSSMSYGKYPCRTRVEASKPVQLCLPFYIYLLLVISPPTTKYGKCNLISFIGLWVFVLCPSRPIVSLLQLAKSRSDRLVSLGRSSYHHQ